METQWPGVVEWYATWTSSEMGRRTRIADSDNCDGSVDGNKDLVGFKETRAQAGLE
jgi:hypothetical protein